MVYYFDIVGSKYLLHPLYREWLAWRKCSCSTGWKLSSLFLVLQVLHSGLHAVTRQPAALCSVVPCILQYYTAIGIIFIVLIEVVIQLLRLLLLWRHQVPARCKNNSTNRPMTRILEILIQVDWLASPRNRIKYNSSKNLLYFFCDKMFCSDAILCVSNISICGSY